MSPASPDMADGVGVGTGSRFQVVEKGVPVAAQIATQLIAAIEAGEIPVGRKLPSETALTRQFGVSRASVREALACLQFAGYVESRRGSSSRVCSAVPMATVQLGQLDLRHPKDVIDLFEARLAVEPAAVREAARAPLPVAVQTLTKLLEGMDLAVGRPELNAHTDIGVHLALVRACPNPFLAQTAEALITRTDGSLWRTIRDQAWAEEVLPRAWLRHHQAVLEAVADHDGTAAAAALRAHLISVLENVAETTILGSAERGRIDDLTERHRRIADRSPAEGGVGSGSVSIVGSPPARPATTGTVVPRGTGRDERPPLWHLGTLAPNYGPALSTSELDEAAAAAERLGYDSLWVTDHVAVPTGMAGTYGSIAEALVTLGYLAARTERIQLGVSALVVPQRPLLLTLKQVMSAQLLSGGRLVLALAAGWTEQEFANLGVDMASRQRRLTAWDDLVATVAAGGPGRIDLDAPGLTLVDAVIAPGFVDNCPPPTWAAGHAEGPLRRAARTGVWHPVGRPVGVVGELATRFRGLRPDGKIVLRLIVRIAEEPDTSVLDRDGRCTVVGPPEFVAEHLDRFREVGVDGFVIDLVSGPGSTADRIVRFAEEVRPLMS